MIGRVALAYAALALSHGHAIANEHAGVASFDVLLGAWQARQRSLQADGTTWVDAPHPARWNFYRILDGAAVQDDWIAPSPDVPLVDGGTRFRGTNLRSYDPGTDTWHCIWISSAQAAPRRFSATWRDGTFVMTAIDTPQPRRNIFSDITASSFRWRQEWSFDGGASWTPVAYIEATRVKN